MTANADRGLAYAATLSLALHALVLALSAPPLKRPFASPVAIVARMVEPAAMPESPALETIKPATLGTKTPRRAAPAMAAPAEEPAARMEPQPVSAVAAAENTQSEAPMQTVSVAPPQAVPDGMSVAQYRQQLITAAVRYKRYPPAAVDNDWQGEVIVRLSVAASGTIAEVGLARSSGHGLLDEQVLEMFRNAAAEAPVPRALRGQEFAIEVRTVYSLKDQ
ncbi:MAG TPA: TonB family protein [Burkholderiales bacterium]